MDRLSQATVVSTVTGADVIGSPSALFASSEKGIWLDPSDLSTMWQDSAGTTPVTASGQPVGKIVDKSPNGVVFTQATSGKRPTLQVDSDGYYYLNHDGTDDAMLSTTNVDFSGTSQITWWCAHQRAVYTTNGKIVFETGTTYTNPVGGFGFINPGSLAGEDFLVTLGTTSGGYWDCAMFGTGSKNQRMVLTAMLDFSLSSLDTRITVRRNRALCDYKTGGTNAGGTVGCNSTISLFARNSGTPIYSAGRLYGLIIRGASTPLGTVKEIENYMNTKMPTW